MDTFEKRYNEALDRAKRILCNIPEGSTSARDIETIFPELCESEDEKIRKCIGMALTDVEEQRFKDFGVTLKDCLAYLEKQKELFESGRGLYYYDGEKTTYCGYPATEDNPYDFAISQQEKQKEQKPVWCNPDETIAKEIAAHLEGEGYMGWVLWINSIRQKFGKENKK